MNNMAKYMGCEAVLQSYCISDMRFENFRALDGEQSKINIDGKVESKSYNIKEGFYLVRMFMGISGFLDHESLSHRKEIFSLFMRYDGLFKIEDNGELHALNYTLNVECPCVLLPYAEQSIKAIVNLDFDFKSLYISQKVI